MAVASFAVALGASLVSPNPLAAQTPAGADQVQPDREAQGAQLAIPFGIVQGQLVISGDDLIFLDSRQPSNSFVVRRENVRDAVLRGNELTISLAQPVQEPAGSQSRLVFRLSDAARGRGYVAWFHAGSSAHSANRERPSGNMAARPEMSFQVKHDHLIGSDRGRLLISPSQIAYESVTDVNSSRRWNISDIKEVKRDGPYKLKIVPFTGDEYNFDLLGQGMSSDQYATLVNLVTSARVSQK